MKKLAFAVVIIASAAYAEDSVIPIRGAVLQPLRDHEKIAEARKNLLFTEFNSIIPQVASAGTEEDGGFFTIFNTINLVDQPAEVALLFFDDNGNSMELPVFDANPDGTPCFECPPVFVPGVGGVLMPGQALAQAIRPSGGIPRVGYAQFISNPPTSVAVTGTFAQIVPGRPLFMTGVPPVFDLHQRAFMYASEAGGFTSSMALVAANGPTSITLTFRSNLLETQCSTSFFMPGGSHRAFILQNVLSCMRGDEGSVDIQGSGFAGIGIWAHDDGAFVTQPLVEKLDP